MTSRESDSWSIAFPGNDSKGWLTSFKKTLACAFSSDSQNRLKSTSAKIPAAINACGRLWLESGQVLIC